MTHPETQAIPNFASIGARGQALVLALGTGRCGTHSLAALLNRQRDAHVTHEEPPVLPWQPMPGRSGIRERLRRLRRTRQQVVDSFCRWLDAVHPLPTNHWAARLAAGWYHEPVWTRILPRYDITDRADVRL